LQWPAVRVENGQNARLKATFKIMSNGPTHRAITLYTFIHVIFPAKAKEDIIKFELVDCHTVLFNKLRQISPKHWNTQRHQ